MGFDVGVRMLELLVHRDKADRREIRVLGILSFLHTNVWKCLFGKTADSLEKGTSVRTKRDSFLPSFLPFYRVHLNPPRPIPLTFAGRLLRRRRTST